MSKYIIVTGGVCSSLGKGVAASSVGSLLECCGLSVAMMKCDPYINVDAGNMENNLNRLSAVRYLLPYPQEAISRSNNVYKNYYGF